MKYSEMTEEQRERYRQYHREYYQTHKGKQIEAVKKWRKENPDKNRESQRKSYKKWYETHKEQAKARVEKYKKEHPEKCKYNTEKHREYQAKYFQMNKDRIIEQRKKTAKNRVLVVRCKDCKHYDSFSQECRNGLDGIFTPDWFCADGERKD